MEGKAYFSVKEAALNLGCNERTAYRAIWEKRLKVKRKQGKQRYLITEENLERFQDSIRGRGKPAKGKKPSLMDLTCPPNIGPGDMLEFGLDERRRNGQETLHSRTDHRHASGG